MSLFSIGDMGNGSCVAYGFLDFTSFYAFDAREQQSIA